MIRMLTAAALCALFAGPVQAQSFFENLARRAAEGATERAVGAVVNGVRGTHEDSPAASSTDEDTEAPTVMRPRAGGERDFPVQGATVESGSGPSSWPLNALEVSYTGDWEFDPLIEAQIDALHEFAKVRCTGCEGGYSHDSWINHHLQNKDPDGVPAMVGRLPVGGVLSWRGIEATGRLEVVSDTSIGRFPCKQVRTVIVRGEETAEAPGLYCKGPTHSFDRDAWAKVLG